MPRYVPEDSLKSPRFTGPATFARLPYVRSLEDVDVALVGVPFDTGVTYRVGGRFGPNAVRQASVMLRPYNPNLDVKPFDVLSCVDFGDIAIVPGFTERSYARSRRPSRRSSRPASSRSSSAATTPARSPTSAPRGRAARSRSSTSIRTPTPGIVLRQKYNHGTWMRRAIEEGLVDVGHSIEVGLRGSSTTAGDWTGLPVGAWVGIPHRRRTCSGWGRPRSPRRPGAGRRQACVHQLRHRRSSTRPMRPEPGRPRPAGRSARDMLAIVRGLTGINFVGFDVVEVIPAYDPAGQTATLAANLAYEMLSLVALRQRDGSGR